MFRPDSFRLYGQFLDIEGNVIQNFDSAILSSQGYINIPISVKRMERDTLEFTESMVFESNLTTASLDIKYWFTDKLG